VTPPERVAYSGAPAAMVERRRLRLGGGEILALARNARPSGGGEIRTQTAPLPPADREWPVTVAFSGRQAREDWFYEHADSGAPRLQTAVAEIDTAVPLTGARFIVRLPYRVDMIDKAAETEGGAIKWTARISRAGAAPFVPHVLRMEVFGPDDAPRPGLARLVRTEDGLAQGEIPVALDDPAGFWIITWEDVATGVRARHRLYVRPPEQ
jgi:hypothetical protein